MLENLNLTNRADSSGALEQHGNNGCYLECRQIKIRNLVASSVVSKRRYKIPNQNNQMERLKVMLGDKRDPGIEDGEVTHRGAR